MCAFYIGWRRPREGRKLFFVGFNKSGTKSLHDLLAGAGYRSVHGRIKRLSGRKDNIAVMISDNLSAGRPVLVGLSGYDVFSDMVSLTSERIIEGNGYFRQFHEQFPNAYFVLNTRPVEDWIRSRCQHDNASIGSFISRYMAATGLERQAVIELWRSQFTAHHDAVRNYFEANKGRLLEFDIRTDIRVLVDFLSPDYRLDATRWRHMGSTADRVLRRK